MPDWLLAFFVAIEQSAFALDVRQSPYIYMVANVAHILFLMVFFAAIAVMDFRLAGAFSTTNPAALLRRVRVIAVLGFLGLVASGAVLFVAEASHVVRNPVYQFKMGLILLGLINIGWFEFFLSRRIRDVPARVPMPGIVRFAGIASLLIWMTVAACGRLIAYV